ncbi:hypothetical protein [Natronoglycomyces albus]|uniref:Uncharacterized protein n=1 Tax=Natronoglycomyces albus TaxID=2811108 RepID=A0A895XRG8_9ACTN|nr:hypothetical protein [Natronoglycomyces albus]QSB05156.1 hypothetical protein JQS30_15585 [Natronoglycomyces albus]
MNYERVEVDTDVGGGDPLLGVFDIKGGVTAIPVISHGNNTVSALWDMGTGESTLAQGGTQIMASVLDLGLQASSLASDPLGTLISWGLDFLVGLIQPLEDALEWVSGSPGDMRDAATIWGRVCEADVKLSEGLAETLTPLAEWTTSDGTCAKQRIDDLAAALFRLAKAANGLENVLSWAQALAEIIKEAIKWLISELLRFLIIVIFPKVAAAMVTFGATLASAVGLAVAESARVTMRATSFINRVKQAFAVLKDAFATFLTDSLPGIAIASLQNSSSSLGGDGVSGEAPSAGGGGGAISISALREAAPVISHICEDTSGVADVVSTAQSEDLTWGVCGLFFANDYNAKVQELSQLTGAASQTLSTFSENLTNAANDWEGTDEELAAIFDGLDVDALELSHDQANEGSLRGGFRNPAETGLSAHRRG